MSDDSIKMTLQLQFRLFWSKLSFRMLYDLDLNEAIDVYDYFEHKNALLWS